MTPEGKVKAQIDVYLKSLAPKCRYFKPQNMGMGESGVADYIGTYFGTPFALEAKRGDGMKSYATPWQWRFLQEWREGGGCAGVVRNVQDVIDVLNDTAPFRRPIDLLQPDRTE